MGVSEGVIDTEAGRANGLTNILDGEYDGYAECVKTTFDPKIINLCQLIDYFFEIIDPYSLNKQGIDIGKKYRTGIYSNNEQHLEIAKKYINDRSDREKIVVEVLDLNNYVKSAAEHQDRLDKYPNDYCHIPKELLNKYKINF
ncbi:methionine sulfoxide reductase A [Candidatus Epulonipiscioides gigas]|nr:methionine sulfoxide reductase A [Epulopiscium sp. SCG-C07WGA-EpuloA2]